MAQTDVTSMYTNTVLYRCYMFRRHLFHLQGAVRQDSKLTAIRYGTQCIMCKVKIGEGSKKNLMSACEETKKNRLAACSF